MALVDHNILGFISDVRSADSLAVWIKRFLSLSLDAQKDHKAI